MDAGLWGFGGACRGGRAARDYFDEHQQELEATYNKSVLPLPQVQAAFDGGDAVASEEWWKRRMRAFVDRRVGGDGEYEGARVQDLYGEIDGELGVEKSDTPCLWDCGHMNLLPESNESLVIGSSVWSRGSEEVESKLSIDSCGKEETMPRLRKLNVECNAVIPSDLWQEMVCAERVALFGRLTGQRDASSLETFYQLQTPFLTREEEADWLGVRDQALTNDSVLLPVVSAPNERPQPLCTLRTMEIPRMPSTTVAGRFTATLRQLGAHVVSETLRSDMVHERAAQNLDSDSALAWMDTFVPTDSSISSSVAEAFRSVSPKREETAEEIQDSRHQSLQMRKLKLDGAETRVPIAFLHSESTCILTKMLRKNAQAVLAPDTETVKIFDISQLSSIVARKLDPWFDSFRETASCSSAHSGVGETGLRQLLVPPKLLHGDESRPDTALLQMIDAGKVLLQTVTSSSNVLAPRPLASIVLNVPSLWSQHSGPCAGASKYAETFDWTQIRGVNGPVESKAECDFEKSPTPERLSGGPMEPLELSSPAPAIATEASLAKVPLTGKRLDQTSSKILMIADKGPATTEDLVMGFLGISTKQVNAGNPRIEPNLARSATPAVREAAEPEALLIEKLARPVLWDLIRKKVLRVNPNSVHLALEALSPELLESIIYQQQANVKKCSKNPSAYSHDIIFEACTSFRQVSWLHTLRMVSLCGRQNHCEGNAQLFFVAQVIASNTYKAALGSSHWKDLSRLFICLGGVISASADSPDRNRDEETEDVDAKLLVKTNEPPLKKQKLLADGEEKPPVRVICSVQFLSYDGILDELSTEHAVSVIERDMQCPIDLVVDERNSICVLSTAVFSDTSSMKSLTYKLAASQVQFRHIWVIIVEESTAAPGVEENLQAFFAALVHFRVGVQTFTSASDEETSRYIRFIIDHCAQTALDDYRTLPRMWFERPFLLEEESQLERFLASTQILSPYAAQSLLHKVSIEDLLSSSLERLQHLVQDSVTEEQLRLLWSMMQRNHGLQQEFGGHKQQM